VSPSLVDERQVSFVQGAHGGYQPDPAPGCALSREPGPERRDGGEFEHGEKLGAIGYRLWALVASRCACAEG
jgi:hypothetical protein